MSHLLNVDTALNEILNEVTTPIQAPLATEHALGRVLAEDITAAVDLPPFRNASMDGYAVRSADVHTSPVSLRVVMDLPAGTAPTRALKAGEAARIMTGAPVPDEADAVIPVEQTDADWSDSHSPERVEIRTAATAGQNIRPVGENIQRGTRVLRRGTVLRPQDIGMLVSLGEAQVHVYRKPKVVVLGTGDELVGITDPLTPGKIRDSNSYTIAALVDENGGEAVRLPPAKDTLESVRALFQEALSHEPDTIVSTAGVSVGQYDVVRTVLDEFGEVGFWRVNVRPGKPLAFGSIQGVPFFGLPGNPVSAMVTFDIFVRPALCKLAGLPDNTVTETAVTGEEMTSDGRRTYVRVKLARQNKRLIATTTGTQSSGALMSMVLADGLLIIPEGETHIPAGTELPVRLLRQL
jgi:molybdopterin molybdotransferase